METPLESLKTRDPELYSLYLAYSQCMQGIRDLYERETKTNPKTELTQVLHQACQR